MPLILRLRRASVNTLPSQLSEYVLSSDYTLEGVSQDINAAIENREAVRFVLDTKEPTALEFHPSDLDMATQQPWELISVAEGDLRRRR